MTTVPALSKQFWIGGHRPQVERLDKAANRLGRKVWQGHAVIVAALILSDGGREERAGVGDDERVARDGAAVAVAVAVAAVKGEVGEVVGAEEGTEGDCHSAVPVGEGTGTVPRTEEGRRRGTRSGHILLLSFFNENCNGIEVFLFWSFVTDRVTV
jgi:hypothetical protein